MEIDFTQVLLYARFLLASISMLKFFGRQVFFAKVFCTQVLLKLPTSDYFAYLRQVRNTMHEGLYSLNYLHTLFKSYNIYLFIYI